MFYKPIYFVLLCLIAACDALTGAELNKIFGSKICIQGSLASIDITTDNLLLKESEKSIRDNVLNTSILRQKEFDKSVLSKLNELAQYNEIEYVYKLEKEEGPPHDRLFTISLSLGEEKYVGEGKSLKKAQQNAASVALESTNYILPPIKEKDKEDGSHTPTVLLNNLAMNLGLGVKYSLLDEEKTGILKSNLVIAEKPKKSYIQKLNESIYSDKNLRIKKDVAQSKGPFRVKVQVGEHFFYGMAHTIQSAKHDAASKALEFLLKNKDNLESDCLGDIESQECKKAKESLKSPISLVHEAAQARKLDIEFEIIDESGPAHKKTFVTQCRLGELITVGEGKSKKESKRAAAEGMLERLPELPGISLETQVNRMTKSKNQKKRKSKKIIKTKMEEIGMAVGNFVDSIIGFGTEGNKKQDDLTDKKIESKKNMKSNKYPKQSHQEEILEITNSLNVEMHFSDWQEDGRYYSLLSLLIDPEHLCLGEGSSEKYARDKAADGALDLLYSLGLYDHFDQKHHTIQREVKEAVYTVLQPDISEDTK